MNKKLTQEAHEALQQFVRQVMGRSVAGLTAAPSYPSSVRLTEPLQICLLAVASRYAEHSLEMNEALLGLQEVGTEGWRALELIALLQEVAPVLLQEEARLEVTLQCRGIYLLERSEEMLAFWLRGTQEGEKKLIYRNYLAEIRRERTWGGAG
jgi:hypothetical protein